MALSHSGVKYCDMSAESLNIFRIDVTAKQWSLRKDDRKNLEAFHILTN
jgi:hypothetical protein